MKIIGITGGVGSGKSMALSYLKEKDKVVVCEADKIGRELQKKGTLCFEAICSYFGSEILTEEMELDRTKLRERVFDNEEELKKLNEIVHPYVWDAIQNLIKESALLGTEVFVLESAILFEGNYQSICDEIWYIFVEAVIRQERLFVSRGYTEETFSQIQGSQLEEEKFRTLCHKVIDNNGEVFQLHQSLEKELLALKSRI